MSEAGGDGEQWEWDWSGDEAEVRRWKGACRGVHRGGGYWSQDSAVKCAGSEDGGRSCGSHWPEGRHPHGCSQGSRDHCPGQMEDSTEP